MLGLLGGGSHALAAVGFLHPDTGRCVNSRLFRLSPSALSAASYKRATATLRARVTAQSPAHGRGSSSRALHPFPGAADPVHESIVTDDGAKGRPAHAVGAAAWWTSPPGVACATALVLGAVAGVAAAVGSYQRGGVVRDVVGRLGSAWRRRSKV